MTLLDVVDSLQNQSQFKSLHWVGLFEEYIEIVKSNPEVACSASQRIYDMIVSYGSTTYTKYRENLIHYNFFDDPFENGKDANGFYLSWLNKGHIQYTCGKWDEDTKTLEEAQLNKLEFYAKRLGIDENSAGKTLVDLGCGWGGCMFFMAEKFGIRCKGVTLSTAQAEYVRDEIKKRKLENLVSVEIDDIHNSSVSLLKDTIGNKECISVIGPYLYTRYENIFDVFSNISNIDRFINSILSKKIYILYEKV